VFREQVINFLEAAVVMLMLTNALSIAAAAYAIAFAQRLTRIDASAAKHPLPAPLARWLRLDHSTR
jgi:hypothetical protein